MQLATGFASSGKGAVVRRLLRCTATAAWAVFGQEYVRHGTITSGSPMAVNDQPCKFPHSNTPYVVHTYDVHPVREIWPMYHPESVREVKLPPLSPLE